MDRLICFFLSCSLSLGTRRWIRWKFFGAVQNSFFLSFFFRSVFLSYFFEFVGKTLLAKETNSTSGRKRYWFSISFFAYALFIKPIRRYGRCLATKMFRFSSAFDLSLCLQERLKNFLLSLRYPHLCILIRTTRKSQELRKHSFIARISRTEAGKWSCYAQLGSPFTRFVSFRFKKVELFLRRKPNNDYLRLCTTDGCF